MGETVIVGPLGEASTPCHSKVPYADIPSSARVTLHALDTSSVRALYIRAVNPDRVRFPANVGGCKNSDMEAQSPPWASMPAAKMPAEPTVTASDVAGPDPTLGSDVWPSKHTRHRLVRADSRDLGFLSDDSIHLIITSPPYWNLKSYNNHPGQLGHLPEYDAFLAALDRVWTECYRVLVPGGRLICVVGDVCLSRKKFGRHLVVPLHADVTIRCRTIGFDNLTPIFWHKITNATYEDARDGFFGRACEPNAILKNDFEYILMQRKPGGYRNPTPAQRRLSVIPKQLFDTWFRQTWDISGESALGHPAPFPLELPYRLIRLFSFVGDTVLDPFVGTGTTMVAALKAHRNSVGVDIDPEYVKMAGDRLRSYTARRPGGETCDFSELIGEDAVSIARRV